MTRFCLGLSLTLVAIEARAEDRVAVARKVRGVEIEALFRAAHVAYPPGEIYIRAFKLEKQLELWGGPAGKPLTLVKRYPICAQSGRLGPKRQEGDSQVPEGFYEVSRFNPVSHFHLALGLNYPNAFDRIQGRPGRLGGDIMVHGNCVTIGCIPIQDAPIEVVYLAALDAKAAGQERIHVDLFPGRLDEEGMKGLLAQAGADASLATFWRSLQRGFAFFERTRRPPSVRVGPDGTYTVVETSR